MSSGGYSPVEEGYPGKEAFQHHPGVSWLLPHTLCSMNKNDIIALRF